VSACNLHCPLCPTGANEFDRPRNVMPESVYRSILDELGEYLFYVRMYIWGEPLLNKNLWQLVALSEERGIGTEISTNLSVPLTDARIDQLIGAGLSWMIVSVDAASKEVYSIYRRGGDFDLVLANTRRIVERKRLLGAKTPYLEWQFIPMRHNEHELEDVVRLGREIGIDGVRYKPLRLDKIEERGASGSGMRSLIERWQPANARLSHIDRDAASGYHDFHCPFLWGHATVHADGGIAPCCETHLPKHDGGHLHEGSFMAQWNNDAFQRMRRVALGQIVDDKDRATPCMTCKVFAKPSVSR
jgi:MoaA/NifB/PqqE/SkfB family radical SAM enzyme